MKIFCDAKGVMNIPKIC